MSSEWVEWSPEAIEATQAWREGEIAKGTCPDSGETLRFCISSDLCDCFEHPVLRAEIYREQKDDYG